MTDVTFRIYQTTGEHWFLHAYEPVTRRDLHGNATQATGSLPELAGLPPDLADVTATPEGGMWATAGYLPSRQAALDKAARIAEWLATQRDEQPAVAHAAYPHLPNTALCGKKLIGEPAGPDAPKCVVCEQLAQRPKRRWWQLRPQRRENA